MPEDWANLRRSAWGRAHPVNADYAQYADRVIPTPWHGDGVEVFDGTEFHVFSWSSALAYAGDALDEKMLIVCIEEARVVESTMSAIIAYFAWNDKVLLSGRHPSCDHLGRPFTDCPRAAKAGQPLTAEMWRASYTATLADLKEKVKTNKLVRNYQANWICELCACCRHLGIANGYGFRLTAAWRQNLTSHQRYLAITLPEHLSPWSAFPAWTLERNKLDMLHAIWLGYGKDVAGSTILTLAWGSYGNMTLDDALTQLWQEMRAWCKGRGQYYGGGRFNRSLICCGQSLEYPTLSSRVKGHNTKLICKFLADKAPIAGVEREREIKVERERESTHAQTREIEGRFRKARGR